MQKNPPFQQWKNKKETQRRDIGRKAFQALSPALQEHLASGLVAADKTRFDAALNSLAVDEPTRTTILKEIKREAPSLPPQQAEALVKRCFRRKVNTLRCMGQYPLLEVVDEVRPGAAKAAREALPPSERLTKRKLKQPAADGSSGEPPAPSTGEPAKKSVEQLAGQPGEQPAEQPVEQPAKQPAEQAAEQAAQQPAAPCMESRGGAAPEDKAAGAGAAEDDAAPSKKPRLSEPPA